MDLTFCCGYVAGLLVLARRGFPRNVLIEVFHDSGRRRFFENEGVWQELLRAVIIVSCVKLGFFV